MNHRRRGLYAAVATIALLLPGSSALGQVTGVTTSAAVVPAAAAVPPVPISNLPIVAIDLTDADTTKNTLSYLNASKDNSVGATVNLVDGSNPSYAIVDPAGQLV
jgi:hypothetical protein